MKHLSTFLIIIIFSITLPQQANAQFLKKLQRHVEKKISNEAENRVNRRADKTIDKAFDSVEDGIDGNNNEAKLRNTSMNTGSNEVKEVQTSQQIDPSLVDEAQKNNSGNYESSNVMFSRTNRAFTKKLNEGNIAIRTVNIDDNSSIKLSSKGYTLPSETLLIYTTSEGNNGKMEIGYVDDYDNYQTAIEYITYNKDGSIKSHSDGSFIIDGTYFFDLDNGTSKNTKREDADFQLQRQDKYNSFFIVKNGAKIAIIDPKKEDLSKEVAPPAPTIKWSKFDFVPGDKIIFEDGPSIDEENGEFPSKWDLHEGNAEIAEVDGVNVVVFPNGGTIVPYLKDSDKDYLPEVFTVEFDMYFQPENLDRAFMSFYDNKNQRNVGDRIYFYSDEIAVSNSRGTYSKDLEKGGWRHFSVAVTKDKLKIYLNDTRLINIPHMGFNPTGITFEMEGYSSRKVHQYMKNFRIAKGGVKYYDSVLSDGKIIVNGIRFDIGKATIKPESMGAINKIYKLMQKKPDLKFSVEGHTDADGNDATNLQLSKDRGEAVMDLLVSMGISANRLKSDGFGESKPIDSNSSNEGKANNRRVEFVKF
ncbi:MAG: OmpA family protein [Flavobacteriales bacterium]|nr:OmpA family protein [Flavobacteriales bacterium]